jgi:hypothetical protein
MMTSSQIRLVDTRKGTEAYYSGDGALSPSVERAYPLSGVFVNGIGAPSTAVVLLATVTALPYVDSLFVVERQREKKREVKKRREEKRRRREERGKEERKISSSSFLLFDLSPSPPFTHIPFLLFSSSHQTR